MPSSKHTKYTFQAIFLENTIHLDFPISRTEEVLWWFLFHNAGACCNQARSQCIQNFVLKEDHIQKIHSNKTVGMMCMDKASYLWETLRQGRLRALLVRHQPHMHDVWVCEPCICLPVIPVVQIKNMQSLEKGGYWDWQNGQILCLSERLHLNK